MYCDFYGRINLQFSDEKLNNCFYFCNKNIDLGTREDRLNEAVLNRTRYLCFRAEIIKSNQIIFIRIQSSHRTVTSHMYTITKIQLQSQTDPYTNVFSYID